MPPAIFSTQVEAEYYTPERCYIIEIMNQPGIEFSIARARIEPGVFTALHSLNGTSEAYYILSGKGAVEMANGKQYVVGAGDIVLYAPHAPQTIKNIGSEDLIFLCVCVPRFEKKAYVNLEV